jgi:hypothetical protein
MTCAWILEYGGADPLPVGAIGATCMLTVLVLTLYATNLHYTFEWWRQTYAISFLVTGLWTIFFTGMIYVGQKKKGDISGEDKIRYIFYASMLSFILILLEFFLVIIKSQFWVAKYYSIGYFSTVKHPPLQEYLGNNSTLLVVDDTMSNAPYIYAYEQQPSPPGVSYETQTETDPLSSTITSV